MISFMDVNFVSFDETMGILSVLWLLSRLLVLYKQVVECMFSCFMSSALTLIMDYGTQRCGMHLSSLFSSFAILFVAC